MDLIFKKRQSNLLFVIASTISIPLESVLIVATFLNGYFSDGIHSDHKNFKKTFATKILLAFLSSSSSSSDKWFYFSRYKLMLTNRNQAKTIKITAHLCAAWNLIHMQKIEESFKNGDLCFCATDES